MKLKQMGIKMKCAALIREQLVYVERMGDGSFEVDGTTVELSDSEEEQAKRAFLRAEAAVAKED